MTALPRVLAMTPAYNGEAFLQRTLESLAAQTYPALRVLIADDASTDATADIAEAHVRRDSRFSLVRRSTNLGWTGNTNAMNKLCAIVNLIVSDSWVIVCETPFECFKQLDFQLFVKYEVISTNFGILHLPYFV